MKPPIAQLSQNFPTFYGTRISIAMFTRALYWSLFWARWIQSIPPQHTRISPKSILIVSSHLRLCLSSCLFFSVLRNIYLFVYFFYCCYFIHSILHEVTDKKWCNRMLKYNISFTSLHCGSINRMGIIKLEWIYLENSFHIHTNPEVVFPKDSTGNCL
jgi:hypothetical protein